MTNGLLLDQLRLIGKTALGFIALLSCSVVFILWLTDVQLLSYRQASNHLFQQGIDLPWMMWMGGSLILLITALSLWLGCLFISHRAAGPLFRFCRNIEAAINQGSIPQMGIRSGDYFQEDSALLLKTAHRLSTHEEDLVRHCRALITLLGETETETGINTDNEERRHRLNSCLARLKATAAQGIIDEN